MSTDGQTRLDRLARSTRDLLNILHLLGERAIGFKSLADTWALHRLLVTMLAGIAEFEAELIKARASDGRARAKARNHHPGSTRFGREPHEGIGGATARIAGASALTVVLPLHWALNERNEAQGGRAILGQTAASSNRVPVATFLLSPQQKTPAA